VGVAWRNINKVLNAVAMRENRPCGAPLVYATFLAALPVSKEEGMAKKYQKNLISGRASEKNSRSRICA